MLKNVIVFALRFIYAISVICKACEVRKGF